jgi:hypothetical protein
MLITHELVIDAPVDRVWALTLDIEAWPATTPTITDVHRDDQGPLRKGSTARLKQPGQPVRTWTVIDVQPSSLFSWQTRAMGMTMLATHRLTSHDSKTRNTLTLELTGATAGVLGPLLRKKLLATIATENEGFRRAAETVRH